MPVVALWSTPFSKSRTLPPFLFADPAMARAVQGLKAAAGEGAWTLAAWQTTEAAFYAPFAKSIEAWRCSLGLPPLSGVGGASKPMTHWEALRTTKVPILYGISPHVLPRPPDWPNAAVLAGYFCAVPPAGADVDFPGRAELEAFLRPHGGGDDRPSSSPIFLTFGSSRGPDPPAVARVLLAAARAAGRRVVVSCGLGLGADDVDRAAAAADADHQIMQRLGGLGVSAAGDNSARGDLLNTGDAASWVQCLRGPVPHDWLFPQVDLVIHHGGAGTTGAAFRAGTPQLILPVEFDQFFWATRAAELGVAPSGPLLIPARAAQFATAADALAAALRPRLAANAKKLADDIRASREDGAGLAAEFIRQYVKAKTEADAASTRSC